MIICPKCGKEIDDNAKFCNVCGAEIVKEATEEVKAEVPAEPVAQEPAEQEPTIAVTKAPEEETPVVTEAPAPAPEKAKKGFNLRRLIAIGCAALVVLILVIISVSTLVNFGDKANSYILYLKDDEMFYSDINKIDPWQVTADMFDGEKSYESGLIYGAGGLYPTMSQDGKILFYPDKVGNENSLYFRYVNKPKKEAVKIDSDIEAYYVNEKANTVIYLRGDGSLYTHNLKDKEKLASDVQAFTASPDGKIVYYVNKEDSLYYIQNKKDAEKIDSEVESIEYISEDYKTIYFNKEDALYKKKAGKDKEKLISDVYNIYTVYEDGSFYFTKDASEEIKYSAYINDDMKDQDAAMVEPVYPDYPTYPDYPFSWNYATQEEYDAAMADYNAECERLDAEYDAAVDAYNENIDAWWEKESRDRIREQMETETTKVYKYALYYYNGKEEKLVCESATAISTAAEKAAVTYKSASAGEIKKQNISEIDSIWDIDVYSEEVKGTRFVAVEESTNELDLAKATAFRFNEEGDKLYYLDNANEEKNTAELFVIEISGKKTKDAKSVDTEISADNGYSIVGKNVYYYKAYNQEKGSGDLYKSGKLVDYDVQSVRFIDEEGETVCYVTEYNKEKNRGTLKVYEKSAKKVADDVYYFHALPNGDILYITDFSTEYSKGTLYKYDGKSKKVDDDVSGIIPVFETEDLSSIYSIYYETFYEPETNSDDEFFLY